MLTTRCDRCDGAGRRWQGRPGEQTWQPCHECHGTGRVEPYEAEPTCICGACNGSGESRCGGSCFTCRGRGEVRAVADEFTVESVEEWRQQQDDEKEMTT